jgi:hypothetical protein
MLSFPENIEADGAKVLLRKDLQHTIVEYRKDGIVSVLCKTGCTVTIADIYAMAKFISHIGVANKYKILIEPEQNSSIDNKARVLLASEEGSLFVLKIAILCKFIMNEMVSNFFIRVDNPVIPTKIFKDKTKAIEWLLSSSLAKIVN